MVDHSKSLIELLQQAARKPTAPSTITATLLPVHDDDESLACALDELRTRSCSVDTLNILQGAFSPPSLNPITTLSIWRLSQADWAHC